jgi:hypothetical protein
MSERELRALGSNLRAFIEGFLEPSYRPDTSTDDEYGSFPPGGIDSFLSHFIFTLQINTGRRAGQLFSATLPASIQTVVRSHPFVYEGRSASHTREFALPSGSELDSLPIKCW